jgi:hypothetical protein
MKKQLILLFLLLDFTSCLDLSNGEKNEVLQEILSPSKNKKAIYFLKHTGATADNSLQVSLKKSDYELLPTDLGNMFTCDSDHGKAKLDTSAIKIFWKNEDTLIVQYQKDLRVFINEKLLMNTTIEYWLWVD